MNPLNKLPAEIRGLAEKVTAGELSRWDLSQLGDLKPDLFERYEFLRVLAGGNPEHMAALIAVAQHSLQRDLSGASVARRL